MNKKEITELAESIAEMANIPNECSGKENCTYSNKEKLCCKVGAPYRIEKLLTKGIEEGIRNNALLLPDSTDEKRKYNIQLQHDGHNQLDRISEYVAAEYMRSHIKEMRFILNELYLNNKT